VANDFDSSNNVGLVLDPQNVQRQQGKFKLFYVGLRLDQVDQ
jgi:hypothetical protein